ncbi:MAG: hypothetical protein KBE09_04845 [Candidatus Pacebacteria bacterium]|nr:hypothetical protein [Candidatus Paceibacterota bacterium]
MAGEGFGKRGTKKAAHTFGEGAPLFKFTLKDIAGHIEDMAHIGTPDEKPLETTRVRNELNSLRVRGLVHELKHRIVGTDGHLAHRTNADDDSLDKLVASINAALKRT